MENLPRHIFSPKIELSQKGKNASHRDIKYQQLWKKNNHGSVCALTGDPILLYIVKHMCFVSEIWRHGLKKFLEPFQKRESCCCVEPLGVSLAPSSGRQQQQVKNKEIRPSCSISNHPPFNTKSRYNIYIHGLKGKNKVHVWGGGGWRHQIRPSTHLLLFRECASFIFY